MKDIKYFRKDWKIGDDALLLGDSGGFQIATGVIDVKKIDRLTLRKKIFNWLEYNTDIAMNIDIPPFVSGFSGTVSKAVFDECLAFSIENYKYFHENQTGKTNFLNVLQGRTVPQMSAWYDKVKDFEFNGWAVGGATNVKHLMPGIKFLLDKGELTRTGYDYLHLLGVSSNESSIYLAYIQKLLNEIGVDCQLTYDSSSPALSAAHGGYVMFPRPTANTMMRITSRAEYASNIEHLPCFCPVCQKTNLQDIVKFKSESYSLLTLHNLYKFIDFQKVVGRILDFNDWKVYQSVFGAGITRNLKALRHVFVEGKGGASYLYSHFKSVEPNFQENAVEKMSEYFE